MNSVLLFSISVSSSQIDKLPKENYDKFLFLTITITDVCIFDCKGM